MSVSRRGLEARVERLGEELRKEKIERARVESQRDALTNLLGRAHHALSNDKCATCGGTKCGNNPKTCWECEWVCLAGRELERVYAATGVRPMATQAEGSP